MTHYAEQKVLKGLFAGLTGGCELQVDKRVVITFVIGDVRFELRHTT